MFQIFVKKLGIVISFVINVVFIPYSATQN